MDIDVIYQLYDVEEIYEDALKKSMIIQIA